MILTAFGPVGYKPAWLVHADPLTLRPRGPQGEHPQGEHGESRVAAHLRTRSVAPLIACEVGRRRPVRSVAVVTDLEAPAAGFTRCLDSGVISAGGRMRQSAGRRHRARRAA